MADDPERSDDRHDGDDEAVDGVDADDSPPDASEDASSPHASEGASDEEAVESVAPDTDTGSVERRPGEADGSDGIERPSEDDGSGGEGEATGDDAGEAEGDVSSDDTQDTETDRIAARRRPGVKTGSDGEDDGSDGVERPSEDDGSADDERSGEDDPVFEGEVDDDAELTPEQREALAADDGEPTPVDREDEDDLHAPVGETDGGAAPTATPSPGGELDGGRDSQLAEDAAVDRPDGDHDGYSFGESFGGEGPESDEEMPLAEHIEEMMRRLSVVVVVALAVMLAVFGVGEYFRYIPSTIEIIQHLWTHLVPNPVGPPDQANRPHLYGPLELVLTQLKVAGLVGFVVGLPVFVYETYLFMRPGLYPKERRYYLAAVPTSLVLAVLGVAFAYGLILPWLFQYFTSYTEQAVLVAYGLSDTFTLILVMMGYMALVFQIPLFIMLAVMMNLVTRQWMEDRRLLFWGGFAGLSFTFVAVDPTGMAPIVIAVTMIVLFEATLALLRWTGN